MTTASTNSVKDTIIKKQEAKAPVSAEMNFQGMLSKQLTTQFKAIQSLVPKHVTPERLCRIGLNAVSRNPKLMECSPATIIGSIVNCATLGLEPNLLGHAYIVPFYNGKTKQFEAQFQIGYKGALELIRRADPGAQIKARAVYEGDDFYYEYGLDDKLKHIPCGEEDDNKISHFYAAYKSINGATDFIVMSKKQMDSHRDKFTKSKTKQGTVFGPWADHYVSMGLKTVILKLIKYLPISIEQQDSKQAMEAINQDNTVMEVKAPNSNLGFGESFIDSNYVVNEESNE